MYWRSVLLVSVVVWALYLRTPWAMCWLLDIMALQLAFLIAWTILALELDILLVQVWRYARRSMLSRMP
jgi:hypothetical protein